MASSYKSTERNKRAIAAHSHDAAALTVETVALQGTGTTTMKAKAALNDTVTPGPRVRKEGNAP